MIVGDRFLDINKPWAVMPHAVSPTTYFALEARLSIYSTILASEKVRPCCIRVSGFIWRLQSSEDELERSIESNTYLPNLTKCYLRCSGWIRAPLTILSALVPHRPHTIQFDGNNSLRAFSAIMYIPSIRSF